MKRFCFLKKEIVKKVKSQVTMGWNIANSVSNKGLGSRVCIKNFPLSRKTN